MAFLIWWLLIGLISTLAAIAKFRPYGAKNAAELYLAALGPFLGPIVLLLLFHDMIYPRN